MHQGMPVLVLTAPCPTKTCKSHALLWELRPQMHESARHFNIYLNTVIDISSHAISAE